SAPNSGSPCSGFVTAIQQFEALLDKALPSVPKASRGGKIPWPFSADGLVNRFSELLASMAPPIDLVCLDKKAELFIDNNSSLKWDAPSLSAVYANYKAGKK